MTLEDILIHIFLIKMFKCISTVTLINRRLHKAIIVLQFQVRLLASILAALVIALQAQTNHRVQSRVALVQM